MKVSWMMLASLKSPVEGIMMTASGMTMGGWLRIDQKCLIHYAVDQWGVEFDLGKGSFYVLADEPALERLLGKVGEALNELRQAREVARNG